MSPGHEPLTWDSRFILARNSNVFRTPASIRYCVTPSQMKKVERSVAWPWEAKALSNSWRSKSMGTSFSIQACPEVHDRFDSRARCLGGLVVDVVLPARHQSPNPRGFLLNWPFVPQK